MQHAAYLSEFYALMEHTRQHGHGIWDFQGSRGAVRRAVKKKKKSDVSE
jgi:hypothetical protein